MSITGFSLATISANMWWSLPSKPENGIFYMRPMEGFDYVMFTINPILPIISFSGIIILIIGITIFFIDRRKNR